MRRRRLALFGRARRGVSAVEFALAAPVMLATMLGVAEVGRFIWIEMKIQNAASRIGDIVARSDAATAADIEALTAVLPAILSPFYREEATRLIVTAVARPDEETEALVAWRSERGGLEMSSAVGALGSAASAPDGLVRAGGDALIVSEIAFRYEPWLLGIVAGATLRETSYHRPRRAPLTRLE